MHLIDTDVLSLLRRPERAPKVAGWMARQADATLFLSAVTLGEVSRGIELQRPRDPGFAADLDAWLAVISTRYADRVLPFGAAEALRWGRLCASVGHVSVDLMIAATALERGLTVATRNLRHYQVAGVRTVDPEAEG